MVDGTTLEHVFRKVGLLREGAGTGTAPSGGKCAAVLDLASQLPVQIWVGDAPTANDKRWLPALADLLGVRPDDAGDAPAAQPAELTRGLLVFDAVRLLRLRLLRLAHRARRRLPDPRQGRRCLRGERVLVSLAHRQRPHHPAGQVSLQRLPAPRTPGRGPGRHRLARLPDQCPRPSGPHPRGRRDLYSRRCGRRASPAFLLVKRLLGLSYLWTGRLQRHRHASLGHLDPVRRPRRPRRHVADTLGVPLERVSSRWSSVASTSSLSQPLAARPTTPSPTSPRSQPRHPQGLTSKTGPRTP